MRKIDSGEDGEGDEHHIVVVAFMPQVTSASICERDVPGNNENLPESRC